MKSDNEAGGKPSVLIGSAYSRWEIEASLDLKPRSVELYQGGLINLFEKMDMTIEEYVTEFKEKAGDSLAVKDMINRVKKVLLQLYKEFSSSYTLQSYKGFLSLMRANELAFNEKDFNKFRKRRLPERSKHIQKISKPEIRELLEISENFGRTLVSKTRNVAVIHIMKDSGLSRSDVVKLNVGDIRPCLEAGGEWCLIQQWREKTGVEQVPIFGPEAMQSLREYLEARESPRMKNLKSAKNPNGRLTEIAGEKLEDDSPLWIYTQKTKGHEYGGRLTAGALTHQIKRMSKKLKSGKSYSPHSFRSYNWTRLEAGLLPKNWISIIQGRSIMDSSEAYTLRLDEPEDMAKLLEAYKNAYHEISTGDLDYSEKLEEMEQRQKDDKDYAEWERTNRDEREEKLEEANRELRERLDKLEAMIEEALSS